MLNPTLKLILIALLAQLAIATGEHPGAVIYMAQCAECHGADGQGVPDEYEDPLMGDRSIKSLARLIERNPKFDGQSIRLISCNTGALPNGAAQHLANKLGVPVLAPNKKLWVFFDGALEVGEGHLRRGRPVITDPGEWVRFQPGGGR